MSGTAPQDPVDPRDPATNLPAGHDPGTVRHEAPAETDEELMQLPTQPYDFAEGTTVTSPEESGTLASTPQEDPQTHPASTPEEDAPEIVPGEKPENDRQN